MRIWQIDNLLLIPVCYIVSWYNLNYSQIFQQLKDVKF